MAKTSSLHVRMESHIKDEAETVLANLGITPAEAVNMFYYQIIINEGMPFELNVRKSKNNNKTAKKSLSGYLSQYANPKLIEKEKDVWAEEVRDI